LAVTQSLASVSISLGLMATLRWVIDLSAIVGGRVSFGEKPAPADSYSASWRTDLLMPQDSAAAYTALRERRNRLICPGTRRRPDADRVPRSLRS
jgi:hypothetical protein